MGSIQHCKLFFLYPPLWSASQHLSCFVWLMYMACWMYVFILCGLMNSYSSLWTFSKGMDIFKFLCFISFLWFCASLLSAVSVSIGSVAQYILHHSLHLVVHGIHHQSLRKVWEEKPLLVLSHWAWNTGAAGTSVNVWICWETNSQPPTFQASATPLNIGGGTWLWMWFHDCLVVFYVYTVLYWNITVNCVQLNSLLQTVSL